MVVEAQKRLGELTGPDEVADRPGAAVLIASPGHHPHVSPQAPALHGLAESLDPSPCGGLPPAVHVGDAAAPGVDQVIDEHLDADVVAGVDLIDILQLDTGANENRRGAVHDAGQGVHGEVGVDEDEALAALEQQGAKPVSHIAVRGGGGQHQCVLQSGGRLEEPVHDESLVGLPDGEAGADEPGVAAAQELGARVRLVAELGGDAQDLATGLLRDAVGAVESRRDSGDGAAGSLGDGPDRDPPTSSSRSFHGRRLPFHAVVPREPA